MQAISSQQRQGVSTTDPTLLLLHQNPLSSSSSSYGALPLARRPSTPAASPIAAHTSSQPVRTYDATLRLPRWFAALCVSAATFFLIAFVFFLPTSQTCATLSLGPGERRLVKLPPGAFEIQLYLNEADDLLAAEGWAKGGGLQRIGRGGEKNSLAKPRFAGKRGMRSAPAPAPAPAPNANANVDVYLFAGQKPILGPRTTIKRTFHIDFPTGSRTRSLHVYKLDLNVGSIARLRWEFTEGSANIAVFRSDAAYNSWKMGLPPPRKYMPLEVDNTTEPGESSFKTKSATDTYFFVVHTPLFEAPTVKGTVSLEIDALVYSKEGSTGYAFINGGTPSGLILAHHVPEGVDTYLLFVMSGVTVVAENEDVEPVEITYHVRPPPSGPPLISWPVYLLLAVGAATAGLLFALAVMGLVCGAITWCFAGCGRWDGYETLGEGGSGTLPASFAAVVDQEPLPIYQPPAVPYQITVEPFVGGGSSSSSYGTLLPPPYCPHDPNKRTEPPS
ncbi:hypothetical protein HK104_004184 [Borealophlyctis nickersoniae]|nr:hypothetical protein HK104_004184 [Borealophlyctis nickersoniae]